MRNSLFWKESDFLHEVNIGGGYRRLMGDASWILGGYGFFDRKESRYDNHFNQGTLGLEALSWNWEGRVNGYIASNDTKSATGAGTAVVQLIGTKLTMAGTLEQAMSGFDAEAGVRLPFFGEEGVLSDTRIYGGGFWFDASKAAASAAP